MILFPSLCSAKPGIQKTLSSQPTIDQHQHELWRLRANFCAGVIELYEDISNISICLLRDSWEIQFVVSHRSLCRFWDSLAIELRNVIRNPKKKFPVIREAKYFHFGAMDCVSTSTKIITTMRCDLWTLAEINELKCVIIIVIELTLTCDECARRSNVEELLSVEDYNFRRFMTGFFAKNQNHTKNRTFMLRDLCWYLECERKNESFLFSMRRISSNFSILCKTPIFIFVLNPLKRTSLNSKPDQSSHAKIQKATCSSNTKQQQKKMKLRKW